jgi:opacity protein-like surface antigen
MNKRVLVLALALVVAFAGSAMANVTFGGTFKLDAIQEGFDYSTTGFKITPNLSVDIKAANQHETDWEFNANIDKNFELGSYRLGLYDDYFKAWVWGKEFELSDKGTPFGFIGVGKKAKDVRARLEIPVVDAATVTLDFEPADKLVAFVDGKVEGYNVGLAYKLEDWSEADKIAHTVGVYGNGAVADVNVKGDVAAKLGDDLGLAVGVGADTMVTDELKVEGSVKYENEKWTDDKNKTTLWAKATYAETEYRFEAAVTQTLITDANENKINLKANYRFSDSVSFDDAIKDDKFFNIDAPAFGVEANFTDLQFVDVAASVSSPVVEDIVWVLATGKFVAKDNFTARLYGYVKATDKLVVKPQFGYKRVDEAFDGKVAADYKIGTGGATLSLTVEKTFKTNEKGKITATVKVPF